MPKQSDKITVTLVLPGHNPRKFRIARFTSVGTFLYTSKVVGDNCAVYRNGDLMVDYSDGIVDGDVLKLAKEVA